MIGRFDDVKQGDLYGIKDRRSFDREYRHEEPDRAGVRAPIVARKPGNSGGAKGCR
jgi:hypothetical protein